MQLPDGMHTSDNIYDHAVEGPSTLVGAQGSSSLEGAEGPSSLDALGPSPLEGLNMAYPVDHSGEPSLLNDMGVSLAPTGTPTTAAPTSLPGVGGAGASLVD